MNIGIQLYVSSIKIKLYGKYSQVLYKFSTINGSISYFTLKMNVEYKFNYQ